MVTVDVLRPAPKGIGAKLTAVAMGQIDPIFRLVRAVWPIPRAFGYAAVTRYDDVREVFERSADFPVDYQAKLGVIMGGEPFILGRDDGPDYRRDIAALRTAMPAADIAARLGPATTVAANARVAGGGTVEVVDYVRAITFEVLCDYFGVTPPASGDLIVWATRLFEFQFTDMGNDPALRREVDEFAPKLRAHIDALIAVRRGEAPRDDVLGRLLGLQAAGVPGTSDVQIRSAIVGFIVGGLPQPPMVAPQALEQLLRRPDALAAAQAAARADDDVLLGALVFEAMRFDPLAPGLFRRARGDQVVAAGTRREVTIKDGTLVLAASRSGMHDGRRVADPGAFIPGRSPAAYMHFGHDLHACFATAINRALIPLMLKALLRRDAFARARGSAGRLTKRGAFADRLEVVV